MRANCVVFCVVVLAAGGLFAAACGEDPGSKIPTRPSMPSFTGAQIVGPAQVAPGKTVQFAAQMLGSDGSTKLTGAEFNRWSTSSPGVLSVNSLGQATGGFTGEAILTLEVTPYGAGSGRRITREIVVLPDGTFRVTGIILDAAEKTPISGARVQVAGSPVVAIAGADGRYRIYGVPADGELIVTADGFETQNRPVHLTGHSTMDFQLSFNGPIPQLAGNYTMAVDVMDSCSGGLPLQPSLRNRSYEAVISQSGPAVEVTLTEPRFKLNGDGLGNRFSGQVTGAGVTFRLVYFDYYYTTQYPNVAEQLSDGTVLVIDGIARVTVTAAGMSGPLSGGMSQWASGFPTNWSWMGGCFNSLKLTLTPR